MAETKEPKPSGRKRQEQKEMASDEFAAAFGLATRLRAHEADWQLDAMLSRWLVNAREELKSRKELERVREFLPVYYDPTRRAAVFGPGAPLISQAAIERAISPPSPCGRSRASHGLARHAESEGAPGNPGSFDCAPAGQISSTRDAR